MMEALRASMDAIRADIKAGHLDMREELSGFCETIKKDIKEELGNFKEVNHKLSEIGEEFKNTEARMEGVVTRVVEVEEWSVIAKDTLLQALEEQERIVLKLMDLETRSSRNDLSIFGIPEGQEGDNACEFLEKFIKSELQLPDIDLIITLSPVTRIKTTTTSRPEIHGRLVPRVQNQGSGAEYRMEKERNAPQR